MIEQMGPEHVADVTRLHCAGLGGLLTSLGPQAVRAYYTGCVRTRTAVGFVALEQGVVRAFVLGSMYPSRLRRRVVHHNRGPVLAALAIGFVTRPRSLALLVKLSRGPEEGDYDPRVPELIYLAVDATSIGSGAGADLVKAFTQEMRGAGAFFYELSVDDADAQAIQFYEGQGFRRVGRYREAGIARRRYAMDT